MLLMHVQTWILLLEPKANPEDTHECLGGPYLSRELLNSTLKHKYIQYIATLKIIVLSLNESINIFPVLV